MAAASLEPVETKRHPVAKVRTLCRNMLWGYQNVILTIKVIS
jgi:hypothetical protein